MLNEVVEDTDDGFPQDDAKAVVVADDRFTEGNAEYVLEVLHNRGHIYSVDERVYIT